MEIANSLSTSASLLRTVRSSCAQLSLYTLDHFSINLASLCAVSSSHFSPAALSDLRSSFSTRYDTPFQFSDDQQHISFVFLRALFRFVHCIADTAVRHPELATATTSEPGQTQYQPPIEQPNVLTTPPDDIVMFGLLGLYMSLPSLNQADLIQVTLTQLSELFNIPVEEEYEVQQAVHGFRQSIFYPLINAYYINLSTAGRQLFSFHINNFGEYLQTILLRVKRRLSSDDMIQYHDLSFDDQCHIFTTRFIQTLAEDFPSFDDKTLVLLRSLSTKTNNTNIDESYEDVEMIEVVFFTKALAFIQDLAVQFPTQFAKHFPTITAYPVLADYPAVLAVTTSLPRSYQAILHRQEDDDDGTATTTTTKTLNDVIPPLLTVDLDDNSPIFLSLTYRRDVIRAISSVLGELQCLLVNHAISFPDTPITPTTTIETLAHIYHIDITTITSDSNNISPQSTIEVLLPHIVFHLISEPVLMLNAHRESVSIDHKQYTTCQGINQLVDALFANNQRVIDDNQQSGLFPALYNYWAQSFVQNNNPEPCIDLGTDDNCTF